MSACVFVLTSAWALTVLVIGDACGPEGFDTVLVLVSVQVVPDSVPP